MKEAQESQPATTYATTHKPYMGGEHPDYGLQKQKMPDVVFVGDSITAYWCEAHPDFFRRNNFAVRGIPGETTQMVLRRFQTDGIDSGADAIALLCGTNDLNDNPSPLTMKQALENLTHMYDEALCLNRSVIVCTLPPCSARPWPHENEALQQYIQEMNTCLRRMAKLRHLPIADYHAAMSQDGQPQPLMLTPDGLHPSHHGYCTMENVIIHTLQELTGREKDYFTTSPYGSYPYQP